MERDEVDLDAERGLIVIDFTPHRILMVEIMNRVDLRPAYEQLCAQIGRAPW